MLDTQKARMVCLYAREYTLANEVGLHNLQFQWD